MKNKNILNFILIVVITGLVLYFSLKDNFIQIMDTIFHMNLAFVVIAVICYLLYLFLKSVVVAMITKNFNKDYNIKKSFRMGLETNFFHAITPFSTGGQPYEIYRLTKDGISVLNAANVSIQNFIIYQLALVFLGLFAIIYNYTFNLFPNNKVLESLVTIGFVINLLVAIILLLIILFKGMNKFFAKLAINILCFFHLVKDKELKLKQVTNQLNEFNEGGKLLLKNKKNFIKMFLIEFLALVILYSIPFFIIIGSNINVNMNLLTVIVASAYVMLIGSFVPIPGGTGGLEYGFIAFYGNFIIGSSLNAIMLVWRFITYYLGMIIGMIVLNLRKK